MLISSGYRKHGLDAYGGKVLKSGDLNHWMDSPIRTDPKGICFELGEDVEVVEAGFFELLPTLTELWILNPKCKIYLSDAAEKIFVNNHVLIRGSFDSAAENFAREHHLDFLHIDTELASAGDYFQSGNNIISICFYDDGSAYINQDCRCQGSSAGNTGGGEVNFNLPKDFYLTMKASEVADQCWGSCREQIAGNGILSSLIKKAKSKKGFLLRYSKQ